MSQTVRGAYGADDNIVDYILGITYEIWEQRGIELIHQYYDADITVYALDGLTRGAAGMVEGTRAMLEAYPDRLLLADDVIWSGSRELGYYSSHRIVSPMTNLGPTAFGPATGRKLRILTIADCIVEDGVITGEWLIRDNHALVAQLGHDPVACARLVAERRGEDSEAYLAGEIARLDSAPQPALPAALPAVDEAPDAFALVVLGNNWMQGDGDMAAQAYAPYAVLHRSPIEWYSGRAAISGHYAALRAAFNIDALSVDHVAVQPSDTEGLKMAVRWTAVGRHNGPFLGLEATGRPVFLLAETHWRIENGHVAVEWTVLDGLGVMSQLV